MDDEDSAPGIALALQNKKSFRTWSLAGLRGRAKQDYYDGFEFDNPGLLPAAAAHAFATDCTDNSYTLFVGATPVAWYLDNRGWVSPPLSGFSGNSVLDYAKARQALQIIGVV
jgi:hypothetical protein